MSTASTAVSSWLAEIEAIIADLPKLLDAIKIQRFSEIIAAAIQSDDKELLKAAADRVEKAKSELHRLPLATEDRMFLQGFWCAQHDIVRFAFEASEQDRVRLVAELMHPANFRGRLLERLVEADGPMSDSQVLAGFNTGLGYSDLAWLEREKLVARWRQRSVLMYQVTSFGQEILVHVPVLD